MTLLSSIHKPLGPKKPIWPLYACLEDTKRIVTQFVDHYTDRRLHSAIGYITPSDMLAGKQKAIHDQSDRKREGVREDRGEIRAQQAVVRYLNDIRPEDGGNAGK